MASAQLVLLQPVAKSEDSALVRQALIHIVLGKLTVQWGVKEGFLHRWVRQAEPLLKEVNAQHRRQRKRRAAGAALGIVRRDKRDQHGAGNHALHLLQEFALARFFHAEIEVQGRLFHSPYFLRLDLHHPHNRLSYTEFPWQPFAVPANQGRRQQSCLPDPQPYAASRAQPGYRQF